MSDTKECCVCYEVTEHLTPCNHLVCESCFPRLNTCPMCRAPFNNGGGFSLDEINWGMAQAAWGGHINIVELMLSRGANDFNNAMKTAAWKGHQNIVELIRERMN